MKKIILNIVPAAVLTIAPMPTLATDDDRPLTEREIKSLTLSRFLQFMDMKQAGVFSPGGTYFGRGGPGFERQERIRDIDILADEGDHGLVCFDMPPIFDHSQLCHVDIISLLYITDSSAVEFMDSLIARFWLALLCHNEPEACGKFIRRYE